MERNIKLLSWILPLNSAWFWLGIWLPFYLNITDYRGIGFLESTVFLFGFFVEIPTGVIADTFGKVRTLKVAFLLLVIGNLTMAFSETYAMLMLSVLILVISGALVSGSDQALLFDSQKQINQDSKFEKLISKISVRKLLTMALASFIGVFAYSIWIGLPFILTGIAGLVGFVLMFFIEEPKIDTEKFTIKESFMLNFKGFSELKNLKPVWFRFMIVLVSAAVLKIFVEIQDPAILLDKGISDQTLGFFYTLIPIVTAFGTFCYEKLLDRGSKFGNTFIFILLGSIFVSIAISPLAGLLINIAVLLYRNLFYDILNIINSNLINQQISSNKRATTLSTYAMIQSLPYVIFGFFIGTLSDNYGPALVGSYLSIVGLALIMILLLTKLFIRNK